MFAYLVNLKKNFFFKVAFPVVIQVTLSTDDNSILQSGGECLRAYLSVAPDQAQIQIDYDYYYFFVVNTM